MKARLVGALGLLGSADHRNGVGAFQGANSDECACYRPQPGCVVYTRDEVPFCRVCERLIDLYPGPRGN